jgi:hypothetical protein
MGKFNKLPGLRKSPVFYFYPQPPQGGHYSILDFNKSPLGDLGVKYRKWNYSGTPIYLTIPLWTSVFPMKIGTLCSLCNYTVLELRTYTEGHRVLTELHREDSSQLIENSIN